MEKRSYIRVYRQSKPFTSNTVVYPDGCVYEMNDNPFSPNHGVCMYVGDIKEFSTIKGRLIRDLELLPVDVQRKIKEVEKY